MGLKHDDPHGSKHDRHDGLEFDVFVRAFLNKVTSYDFLRMDEEVFNGRVDHFLISACSSFERIFRRHTGKSFSDRDDKNRRFNWDLKRYDAHRDNPMADFVSLDEVVDIVSEGMVLKWLDSFMFSGDSLDLGNFLETRDFTVFSPSSFLSSMRTLYQTTSDRYKNLIYDFSYNHGKLYRLHM